MMIKKKKALTLLYRSFDDQLSEKETRWLGQVLEYDPELREEKQRIEKQREAISHSAESFSFGPFFAEGIMNRLNGEKRVESAGDIFFRELLFLFKRFAAVAALLCLVLISYNLVIGESVKAEEALYLSQDTYDVILEMPLF